MWKADQGTNIRLRKIHQNTWLFADRLQKAINIPVGMIQNKSGGHAGIMWKAPAVAEHWLRNENDLPLSQSEFERTLRTLPEFVYDDEKQVQGAGSDADDGEGHAGRSGRILGREVWQAVEQGQDGDPDDRSST